MIFMKNLRLAITCFFLSILLALIGCDRMITPRHVQIVKDADAKATQGNFSRAINLYEAALDDSPHCAEIHYKLALLYDDKMSDRLDALHHFKRYLALDPNGSHANEVKNLIRRDEIALLTSLSGDSVVTRAEAARLRNENLDLRKELEERSQKSRSASGDKTPLRDTQVAKEAPKKSGSRTYVVRPGDTLASISRRFYKTSARWKQILQANASKIDNPEKLRVGETLTIP